MKINKLLLVMLVVFLLTFAFLVYYMRFKTSIISDASRISFNSGASSYNSYVFASPIRATVGGDSIRVYAFVLDESGNGVQDKIVSLRTDSNVTVREIQTLTDSVGRAIFDLDSQTKGSYIVETLVENKPIDQKVKVIFDSVTESR